MQEDKIVVARLWSRYKGQVPSRAPIILGIDPQKYRTICIYLTKNSEEPNFFKQKGCEAFYLSRKKFLRAFNLYIIYKLAGLLKRKKVDILHCHRHQATIYGTIAAKLAGVPVIFSHVHGIDRTKNWRRGLINFVVLRWVNKILTVGESVKENILKTNPVVHPEQVLSLGNSIEYERFTDVQLSKQQAKKQIGLQADSLVFGTLARMVPNKGHIYLIRAFEKVKKTLPSAQLVFIGDGRLRGELETQAHKLVPNCVHFLGHRDDIPQLLKAIDVYVQPSIGSEGLPKGLLEAMAAGVPCIGTQVGGIPEIIANDEGEYLVPPKDDSALAEAMLKVTTVPEPKLRRLVQNARDKVQRDHGHSVVIKRLENIYEIEINR